MNSKQKLLTFTAIGTVFATAIATVALVGNKNLQELRAGPSYTHGVVFDKDSVDKASGHYDEDYTDWYVYNMSTTTKNTGYTVSGATMWYMCDEMSKAHVGNNSIIDYDGTLAEDYNYIGLYFYIDLQIFDQLETELTEDNITVTGTFVSYYLNISIDVYDADESHEKDYYEITIFVLNDEHYPVLSIESIDISYNC